jgi:hypothetical protein
MRSAFAEQRLENVHSRCALRRHHAGEEALPAADVVGDGAGFHIGCELRCESIL